MRFVNSLYISLVSLKGIIEDIGRHYFIRVKVIVQFYSPFSIKVTLYSGLCFKIGNVSRNEKLDVLGYLGLRDSRGRVAFLTYFDVFY